MLITLPRIVSLEVKFGVVNQAVLFFRPLFKDFPGLEERIKQVGHLTLRANDFIETCLNQSPKANTGSKNITSCGQFLLGLDEKWNAEKPETSNDLEVDVPKNVGALILDGFEQTTWLNGISHSRGFQPFLDFLKKLEEHPKNDE